MPGELTVSGSSPKKQSRENERGWHLIFSFFSFSEAFNFSFLFLYFISFAKANITFVAKKFHK